MDRRTLTTEELADMLKRLSNWGRWGVDDQRGALNYITPAVRASAARLVESGEAVSLANPIGSTPASDNPSPALHLMIRSGLIGHPMGSSSSTDYVAVAPHGYYETHLDALCHFQWENRMYNGFTLDQIDFRGAHRCAVDTLAAGIIGRGVLLDIAKTRGADWLEPGEAIYPQDLAAAEQNHRVHVGEGDIVIVRTGRSRRRKERGPWDVAKLGLAGLDVACLPWLHERRVAVLGCDGISDLIPTAYEAPLRLPIHVGTLVMMGVHLIDNADLDALAERCDSLQRYQFMFVLAPLVIRHGTGSPANPLAIF